MTLNNIKTLKNQKGFTIVELLIVIVVIAILAAIVIVAYNGVQNRARDSNNRSDATSIVKVAEARNADRGTYPTSTTELNDGETSRVPSGVSLTTVTAAIANNATNFGTLRTSADATPRAYSVRYCGANVGVTVYFPQRSDSSVQSVNAGQGC